MMIERLLNLYTNMRFNFHRIPKTRWISFVYELNEIKVSASENNIFIRMATETDIEYLENHHKSSQGIIQSVIQFWREYGFRSLYLGFFDGESDPTVLQYVLDDTCNILYQHMEYGGMYTHQASDTVQVENIYLFRDKHKKLAALRFERKLFAILHGQGKKQVRTHISKNNRAALIWAKMVGFRPDNWITMINFNIPGLRWIEKRFIFSKIKCEEYTYSPISPFKS